MTRVELGPRDAVGDYLHQGAAVYRVESGNVDVEISGSPSAVIWSLTGDPDLDPIKSTCEARCVYAMQAGNWVSFDRNCTVKMISQTDTETSVVLIASLTRKGGGTQVRSLLGNDMVIVLDARQPLLPWERGLIEIIP
jgi:hypothetical protein